MSSVDQSWRITEDMIAWVRSLIGVEMRPQSTYFNTQASRDTVRHFVDALADPNPLYRDESYARTTRLGTLAAPPSFLYSVYLRLCCICYGFRHFHFILKALGCKGIFRCCRAL